MHQPCLCDVGGVGGDAHALPWRMLLGDPFGQRREAGADLLQAFEFGHQAGRRHSRAGGGGLLQGQPCAHHLELYLPGSTTDLNALAHLRQPLG